LKRFLQKRPGREGNWNCSCVVSGEKDEGHVHVRQHLGNLEVRSVAQVNVEHLKDNDDLVSQLVAKYGLEKDTAQRDAATVVKGRTF
jgi:hypothetical protein